MNRKDKEIIVEELREKFADHDVAVLTRFTGLKVEELNELRNACRKISVDYRVVKNTMVRRAMEGTDIFLLRDRIQGPLALALARKDIVPVAKLLAGYAKEHPKLMIHAGLSRGKVLDADAVAQAATLPTTEELLAKLAFLMNAPLIQLMNVMKSLPAKLVRTLSAIHEKKGEVG